MYRSIPSILIAGLLIAIAGPALAKKDGAANTAQTQAQTKRAAKKTCRKNPPPFMYNPRFMNRGFFKGKCRQASR